MVIVVLHREGPRLVRLTCAGHAEFSNEGGDIVCAAVSALTGYLGLTLSEVLGLPGAVSADDGQFELRRPAEASPQEQRTLDVLLEGFVRAVRGLEENYSGWVRVEETNL